MVKPKKALGQHFLIDHQVVEQTAEACKVFHCPQALEVGPGEGVLTKELIPLFDTLKLIEIDFESIDHLNKTFPVLAAKDSIVAEDFLKWAIPDGEWLLVGNFPYNISSQIIFKLIENKDHFVGMVGMFQKEVAERIVSEPGSKAYGIISILTQIKYDVEYLFTVGPKAFRPPPKVQSGVIRLTRRETPITDYDEVFFKRIVKQSFNQRRKMLRNTLKEYLSENTSVEVDPYLTQRPEQLHYKDFVKLAQLLKP